MRKRKKTNGGLARKDKLIIAKKLANKGITYQMVYNAFSNRAINPDAEILIRKEYSKILKKRMDEKMGLVRVKKKSKK
jgi:hypothetical protein